jgi:hypothetical protein
VYKENLDSGTGSTGIRHMVKTSDGYVKTEEPEEAPEIQRLQKSANRKYVYFGKGTTDSTNDMLDAIINVLMTIADNTDKLNTIVAILNQKLGVNITADDIANNTGNTSTLKQQLSGSLGRGTSNSKMSSIQDSIDNSSINAIMNAMDSIAAE